MFVGTRAAQVSGRQKARQVRTGELKLLLPLAAHPGQGIETDETAFGPPWFGNLVFSGQAGAGCGFVAPVACVDGVYLLE